MSELLAIACCCGSGAFWQAIRCSFVSVPDSPPIIYIPKSNDLKGLGFVVFTTAEHGTQCYSVDTTQPDIPAGDVPPELIATFSRYVGNDCAICESLACEDCGGCPDVIAWSLNFAYEFYSGSDYYVFTWVAQGMAKKSVLLPNVCSWSPFGPFSGTYANIYDIGGFGSNSSCVVSEHTPTGQDQYPINGVSCQTWPAPLFGSPPNPGTSTFWSSSVTTIKLPNYATCAGVGFPNLPGFAQTNLPIRLVFPRSATCPAGEKPIFASRFPASCWGSLDNSGSGSCTEFGEEHYFDVQAAFT